MKKNKKIALIICVLLVICSFVGVLIYHNATVKQYKEQQYLQIDGYHNAKMNSIKKGRITLYLETSLSLSKQKEMQLFDVIEKDYQTLESALNLKSDVKVAIISDEYILSSNNGFIYHDGIVLCNLGAFENGKYKTALTGAYMKTTETWKQVAATHYYFNKGASVDISKLKDYYAQNEDDLLLTLFQGYFNASFASDEVIDIANMTAVSLGKYIIDNYSFDDFLNASLTDYRCEWLSQNGINTSFDVPFDLSWLSGAVYSQKLLQYPLVIETKNRVYYLDSFHAERNSATFDHPRAVIEHLSNGNAGVNKVLEYIKSNATKNTSDTIQKNAEAKIEYYISSDEIGTEADVNNKKVYLKDPSEFVHETAHILTLNNNRVDGAWLAEGIAEYLSREISGVTSDVDYRMYHSFVASDVTVDLKSFVEDVKTQYKSSGGSFDSFDVFEFYLLEQSIAYVTLTKPEYKHKIKFPYATTSVKDLRYSSSGDKGNNLTYPESYLFVKYLINEYGLNNVLNCCLTYDLEQSFNETYDVLYSNFIKAIQ